MAYLVNQYSPGHKLYPADAKKRADIERVLYLTAELFNRGKAVARPVFYQNQWPPSEEAVESYLELLKVLEQLTTGRKFLAGDEMTIADIAFVNNLSFMADIIRLDIETVASDVTERSKRMKTALPEYKELVGNPVTTLKERLGAKLGHKLG